MKRRKCTDCLKTKSLSKFGMKSGKQAHCVNSICKACMYQRVLVWRAKNPEKAKAQQTRHKLRLKEKLHGLRRANKRV